MEDITGRIIAYCEVHNLRQSDIVNYGCGSKQTVSNVFTRKTKPDAAFLSKLLEHNIKLNARWLLTGDGEMITKQDYLNTRQAEAVGEPYGKCPFCADKERIIKSLEKTIELLEFNLGKNRKTGSQ